MMSPPKKMVPRSFLSLVGLVLGLCFFSPLTVLGEQRRIELKRIFEFKPKSWGDWPRSVLTPAGDQIHFLSGPALQVIDLATRRVVAKGDYSHLPCAYRQFYAWLILPGGREILANYCASLILIDGRTFKVAKTLVEKPFRGGVAGVELSPDGLRVAVVIQETNEAGTRRRLVFLNTETWKEEKSWPVDASGLAFSEDGRLLAIEHREVDEKKFVVSCGIEIRQVDSWKIVSDWRPAPHPDCPHHPLFVPGSRNLIAAALDGSIVFWDLEKQHVVKELRARYLSAQFFISPDGSLLFASFVNDPEVTEYKQDFIAWDLQSGSVVYESKKVKWSLFEKLREPWLSGGPDLEGFSADGKYLLVTRHKRLTLYKIIR